MARKPRFDLAAQVKSLGADSLLPGGTFLCESEVFNGPSCKKVCKGCSLPTHVKKRSSRPLVVSPPLKWFEDYEVRRGDDGKVGIYLRDYNVRVAIFNANTAEIQTRLKLLFERADEHKKLPRKPKRSRKFVRDDGAFSGDVGDQGYKRIKMPKDRR